MKLYAQSPSVPHLSLLWSSTHLWSMTSSLLPDLSVSTCPHPISHDRRGKCFLQTVPRVSAWFRSPWLSLDHCDTLLTGLCLDWHPPLFSLTSFKAPVKCQLPWRCFPTPLAQGDTFPSELWQQLGLSSLITLSWFHCFQATSTQAAWDLTPLWIPFVSPRGMKQAPIKYQYLMIPSSSISYKLEI